MSGTYWQCAECDLVYTHSDGLGVTERFEPKVCMECRDDEDDPVPLYPVDVVKGGTVAALREELTAARAIVARLEDDRLVKKVAGRSVGYCVKLEAILAYRARVRGLVSEGEEGSDGC